MEFLAWKLGIGDSPYLKYEQVAGVSRIPLSEQAFLSSLRANRPKKHPMNGQCDKLFSEF